MYDMIIIGAGTAGLSAAIYGVRAGKSVLVLEGENYGGQIINSPEVENYPGIAKISGFEFATGLYEQAQNLGAVIAFEAVSRVEDVYKRQENILRRGDYILEADGKMIHSIDGLTEILENWKGGDILLNVLRGKDETALRMTPVRTSESEYKIGAWIRQDAQGIGTLLSLIHI